MAFQANFSLESRTSDPKKAGQSLADTPLDILKCILSVKLNCIKKSEPR